MDIKTKRVLTSGWLGHLDPALAKNLLTLGTLHHYAEDQMIYGFDDEQTHLFGVASGVVRANVTMNERDPFLGHLLAPGHWFGEAEIITKQRGVMELVAARPTTLCVVNGSAIETLAQQRSDVWHAMAVLSVMTAAIAITAADDLTRRAPKEKLAAVLLRLSSHRGASQGNAPLSIIPATQADLSELCGLSRSITTSVLSEFSAQGFIQRRYGEIALLDPEGLSRILND